MEEENKTEVSVEEKSMSEKIKEFIETCSLLKGGKVDVDYLKDEIDSFSIEETPTKTTLQKFKDGGCRKQINFDFCIQAPFNVLENIKNSKFCDDFTKWIELQERKSNYPKIEGAEKITCDRGTILHTTKTTAIYVIPIHLEYVEEVY